MKKIFFFIVPLAIFLNCKDDKIVSKYPSENIALIRPKAFESNNFIDSISFVNLELTENSMFSFSDKVLFENDKYYIFDRIGRNHVYVFAENGKFISKIGTIGRGPQEYIRIRDFDIDVNGNVLLYDYQRKRMLKYNEHGEFLESFEIDKFRADAFKILKNGNYLFSIMKENPNETLVGFHLVLTDSNFNIIDKMIPMKSDFKDNYLAMDYLRESSVGITYCKSPRPIIYKLDEKGIVSEELLLNFEKPAPQDLINDASKSEKYSNDFYETLIFSPILTNKYIMGNSEVHEGTVERRSFFLFDLDKKFFYKNIIGQDSFSHKNINFPILSIDDYTIVSYLMPSMLGLDMDKDNLPKNVIEHLKKSGYVLVKYHLKK